MKKYFVILLLITTTYYCLGQDSDDDFKELKERKKWSLAISPYAWLAGNATDVGGEKLRQSFNDLSSLTNFGFQMATNARYKRFTATVDWTYAHLASSIDNSALTVDANVYQWIVDNKLGYIVYDNIKYNEDNVIAGWSIEANIGGKYWLNDIDVDYTLLIFENFPINGNIKEKQDWWDLMLGLKSKFILSKSVLLSVSGDVGGFGIGNSSDFTWDFTYANTFKVSNLVLVSAGYRSFRYKRTEGSGENEVKTKVHAYGPFIGVSFVL
ncbi:MAG: hypothetical protein MI866_16230 [Bacteroidales bacterium]|nr:hypothetical protein [Bacteroidales bacterium]